MNNPTISNNRILLIKELRSKYEAIFNTPHKYNLYITNKNNTYNWGYQLLVEIILLSISYIFIFQTNCLQSYTPAYVTSYSYLAVFSLILLIQSGLFNSRVVFCSNSQRQNHILEELALFASISGMFLWYIVYTTYLNLLYLLGFVFHFLCAILLYLSVYNQHLVHSCPTSQDHVPNFTYIKSYHCFCFMSLFYFVVLLSFIGVFVNFNKSVAGNSDRNVTYCAIFTPP